MCGAHDRPPRSRRLLLLPRRARGPPSQLGYRDRRAPDRRADLWFLAALWQQFGAEPFERGNLDAGRLSWLFGREVLPYDDPFDPEDYEARLIIDEEAARRAFPDAFEDGGTW